MSTTLFSESWSAVTRPPFTILRDTVAALKVKLVENRLQADPPGQVADDVGEKLAEEF